MKNIKLLLIISFAITTISCNKLEIAKETPSCIVTKIKQFNKQNNCAKLKVDEYIFENKKVYVFDESQCGADMQSEVVNSNCESLGFLGGISGSTTIDGINFANAKFQKNIWTK